MGCFTIIALGQAPEPLRKTIKAINLIKPDTAKSTISVNAVTYYIMFSCRSWLGVGSREGPDERFAVIRTIAVIRSRKQLGSKRSANGRDARAEPGR
jgi:hypothetical protein